MSTLNFDALNNQNHHSGLSMSEQCWEKSNLFSDASLASSSYGSGQYGTLFGETYNLEEQYCPGPSLYNPVVSENNNSRTAQVPSTSSVCEEDLDDEEDGILSNLPSSCQDFEAKEMHIRLERNQSSPLVTGHVSPAHSSKLSSGCHSVEPPHEPVDPDDLEVQWINESFEEQQKATLMYQSGDLKTLFYHGSDHESSKAPTRSSTEKSLSSPVERPERLPYAKKLLSQDSSGSLHDCRPVTPTQTVKSERTFEPLLTPKSEALIKQQAHKKSNFKNRRVSEPLARKPPLFWSAPEFKSSTDSLCGSASEVFEVCDTVLPEGSKHVSFAPETLRTPTNCTAEEKATDDRTEELAKGIVESLFVGWTPTEAPPKPFPNHPEQARSARKLNMDDKTGSDVIPPSQPSQPAEAEDDGDSWDNLDDDKLLQQMEELKIAAASKPQTSRKVVNYFEPPIVTSNWNPLNLPHVLEAYNIPEYKLYEDVVSALESLGYGNAIVKWIERKIVLVAFECEKNAKDVLILKKHQWLNLRPLAKSPPEVQEAALANERVLRPPKTRPKTHVGVARRMVEGALGMKANVSREKKIAEQKELREAKAAKKSSVKWDE